MGVARDYHEDRVSTWISIISQRDNGAIFMKDVKDSDRSYVTYGELRMLINGNYDDQDDHTE